MTILKAVDLFFCFAVLIALCSLIADKRSAVSFKEKKFKMPGHRETRNLITSVILTHWKILLLVPVVIGLLITLVSTFAELQVMCFASEGSPLFLLGSKVSFEGWKDFLVYVLKHIHTFSFNVLSYLDFFALVSFFGGLLLTMFIRKNKTEFSVRKRNTILAVLLLQAGLLGVLIWQIASYEVPMYRNPFLRFAVVIIDTITMTYILSIYLGALIRILVSSFSGQKMAFKQILTESVNLNGKIFLVLLVTFLFSFPQGALFYKYIVTYLNYLNPPVYTFMLVQGVLCIIGPILIIRLVMYRRGILSEIKSTAGFIGDNLINSAKYLLIFFVVNMALHFLDSVWYLIYVPAFYYAANILKMLLFFCARLLVFVFYTRAVFRLSAFDAELKKQAA